MDCRTPGFPVLHYLPEFAQIHVHWVDDAIQPSHPLSPLLLLPSIFPSIKVFSSESVLHQVAKVLELRLQPQSFQWIFRTHFLSSWLVWSPCSSRGSQESSPAPQFKSINSLVLTLLYGPTLTPVHATGKTIAFIQMWCLCFLITSFNRRDEKNMWSLHSTKHTEQSKQWTTSTSKI